MRKSGCLFLLGILFLSVTGAYAQNYMNVLNGRFFYLPSPKLKNDSTDISFREYRIESSIPIQLKNGSSIGIKPQYKTFTLSGKSDSLRDLTLYSFKLPLFGFIKLKDSKWSFYVEISPKLNSDLKNITIRHFQIGSTVLAYYEKKKDYYWQFGIFYNEDTYGPFIMPLVGVDWKIDERNYLAVLLPAYMIYERKLSKKFYTGFEMELTGETYRLGNTAYKDSYISQFGENKLTFLTEPRLFLDYYIAPHLVLYVKPGMRLFQKYEQFNDTNDKLLAHPEYVQGQLKPSFYTEFGIALRFRYDEENKKTQGN